jgi:hypothetical protein
MRDLSIAIPARHEIFLPDTIESILTTIEGDTEIIVVLDGYWPNPPIYDHPRVHLIHHSVSVGQRAATNEAVRLSTSKYVMKLDAHCMLDKGFDVKLMAPYENHEIEMNTTSIPRLYNLHAFNWKCKGCGYERYQSPSTNLCPGCSKAVGVDRVMVWKPRLNRMVDFCRFGPDLIFNYWRDYKHRPEAQSDLCDVMGNLGACFLMTREQFLKIDGLDERHGSWGQCGTEVSCKSWLSGGRQIVNKRTWYSHLFRTQGGDFGFPYPLTNEAREHARLHSRWLWLEGNWEKAVRPFSWIIDHFAPVPGFSVEKVV